MTRRVVCAQLTSMKLPRQSSEPGTLYVRSTAVPRALESVQQILQGLYPGRTNQTSAPWDISIRTPAEETLYPNTKSCARLAELAKAFSRRAAEKWNGSNDMAYLSEKLGKWMPGSKAMTVDSRPRLSAVMDTINATLAHGPDTRLPEEFYDERVRRIIDRIVIDERFHGYAVSREFRMLGVGELMGNMVSKMVDQVVWNQRHDILQDSALQSCPPPRLSLSGCHDNTIGATLASLGCFNSDERWPAFTSHVIFELFRKGRTPSPSTNERELRWPWHASKSPESVSDRGNTSKPQGIGRRPVGKLTTDEVQKLDEYFVRIRYNDRIMTIPGCRPEGKHLDGDESLCTLVSFPPQNAWVAVVLL